VCGGIGAHLAINPWWIRLGWLLFTLASPVLAIFAYGLLWLTMPAPTLADLPDAERPRTARPEGTLLLGLAAILLGIAALATNFGFWQSKQGDLLLPILVALTGLVLLSRQIRRGG
jgi:phage shock protein PspC (stress-responsive transcriptional regulator)